ncbi:DNA mismatch repair endonuclease MutL [Salinirarus marinus]|uniref:DNA mismatch repair endonuclease MutL n=1 Tax=Salinirarus marinus TaxID=3068310 RepID=UPI003C6C1E83
MTIRRLDAETVDRIAAGEVVTRPARVVAELVENSLDAGADDVAIEVDGDGTDRIRVVDDGRGMDAEMAELAVERHTTSKLPEGDLTGVETLGFRGEALASVAEVATLEVTTNDGGPRGTRVVVEDGETDVAPAGRAEGTTVEVRDLFHNRRARRDSLASPKAEFARISGLVSRYALVRPSVRFRLHHDGREVFATPGSGDYADALLGVYDRQVASRSTELDAETGVDDRSVAIRGALCYPSITRSTRDHVYVAVNGRPLTDERLRRAVVAGYGSLLPSGRAPVAVVDVSLPSGAVDPNVHPAKERVAVRAADAVESAVERAVADALSTADLRRSAEVSMDLDSTLSPLETDSVFDDATVVGQFRGLYLLCAADDGLLVVDQHAAHERVNYERLRAAVDEASVPSATLDPPETVSLSPAAAAAAEAHRETLRRLGFDVAAFGGNTYRLRSVPAPLGRVADVDAFREALAALRSGEDPDGRRDELLADLACHPSLKAGDDLTTDEASALLDRLGQCDQPFACPHGRPTVLEIEEQALARGFEREATRFG